jgi:hypothetical protein
MKQLNTWIMPSLLMAVLASSASAFAGVVAIVNKANTTADKSTISKLYSVEDKFWADGTAAKLYDQSDEKVRDAFCKAYTGKPVATIKSIWAKGVFTGHAVPPKMLESDADVKS